MKWIGQHIWDFISRFRTTVYIENLETSSEENVLVVDSDGKVTKNTTLGGADLTYNGSTADGVLTYGSASTIDVESTLTYGSGVLGVTSALSVKPVMSLINSNTDAGAPIFNFQKTTTGANDDQLGNIRFLGDNVNDEEYTFAQLVASIADATDGAEAGKLELKVAEYDGTLTTGLKLDGDTNANGEIDVTIGAGAASVTTIAGSIGLGNNSIAVSATDGGLDLLSDTNMRFAIDADNDGTNYFLWNINGMHGSKVGMAFDDTGILTVGSYGTTTPQIKIHDQANDANGPELIFHKQRSTGPILDGADGDIVGDIQFNSYDDGTPSTQTYANIQATILDATSGQEAGGLKLNVAEYDGTVSTGLLLDGNTDADGEIDVTIGAGAASTTTIAGDLTLNGDTITSAADLNIVATGNDIDIDTDNLTITSAGSQKPVVTIKSTTNDNKGSSLSFVSDKGADGADGDYIGGISFYGDNIGEQQTNFGLIQSRVVTAADGDEAGQLLLRVATSNDSISTITTGLDIFGHATTADVGVNIGYGVTSLTTIAGDLDIDGDNMTSAGAMTFTPVGLYTITAPDISGLAFHIDADADTDNEVQIDAGLLDINATASITIDAADDIGITAADTMTLITSDTGADGRIRISSGVANSNTAIHLDGNANAASIVDIDAGVLDIDVTGVTTLDTTELTITGKANIPTRKFTVTGPTHFEYQGDVLYFGGGSTTQGDLCYLKEDGEWGQADADGAATGDDADRDAMGMLAIALGTDPDVDGMFIKGTITMDADMGDVGNPIYVKTAAGDMTSSPSTASGDFIRIVGYCLDDTNGQIYFDPDNTWVEIA